MNENPYAAPTEVNSHDAGPTSRMTATATRQGQRNAIICAVFVFAFSGLLYWFLVTVTALPRTVALFSAFMIPFAASLFVMLASWIRGLQLRGALMMDCGPHPGRRIFLFNTVMFLALGLSGSVIRVGATAPVFMTLFAAYWAFMATGRFSVYSGGLWVYHILLPWDKISDCSWTPDNTLMLRSTGLLSWSRSAIPVPAERVDEVSRLLAQHVSQTNKPMTDNSAILEHTIYCWDHETSEVAPVADDFGDLKKT